MKRGILLRRSYHVTNCLLDRHDAMKGETNEAVDIGTHTYTYIHTHTRRHTPVCRVNKDNTNASEKKDDHWWIPERRSHCGLNLLPFAGRRHNLVAAVRWRPTQATVVVSSQIGKKKKRSASCEGRQVRPETNATRHSILVKLRLSDETWALVRASCAAEQTRLLAT